MRRIVTINDLETTGFKAERGDRIVELCLGMYDLDTREELRMISTLVNPLREIPAAASKVNHIYNEDVVDSPVWDKVAPIAAAALKSSALYVAHNSDFDAPFLGLELQRVNQQVPDVPIFCTMRNGRWATISGKNPSLKELCWALDIDYDVNKAHRAEYDVRRTAECLFAGIDKKLYTLPI